VRHRPRKSLGQNFLIDRNIQEKIVDAIELRDGDTLLEIGPGRGALTEHLARRADRLVAVELDERLVDDLRKRFGHDDHLRIVQGDFLAYDLSEACDDPERLVVVGNIPYNITTPIVFKLLERPRPRELLVMVQKEVAERIVAGAGGSDFGALAVGVQTVAGAVIEFEVPRRAFRPVPRVDSALVRITPIRPAPLSAEEETRVRTLTRSAFQWRRKQLQKILRSHPDLGLSRGALRALEEKTGWDLRRRPETLTPEDFVRLAGLVRDLR